MARPAAHGDLDRRGHVVVRAASTRLSASRVIALTATGVLLLFAAAQTVVLFRAAAVRGEIGWDADLYAAIGTHFLATGQAYFPIQSAPYPALGTINLYPPTALYLFVPASFMPRILWWAIPLLVIAWSLVRLRPAWWAWPLMALACVVPVDAPEIPIGLVYGNTLLWTMAALFAAAAFRPGIAWAAAFKPADLLLGLPFAVRSRRGCAVAVGASLILLPLWGDWLAAIRNLQGASPFLVVATLPALAVPSIAYLARTGRARAAEHPMMDASLSLRRRPRTA